MTTAEQPVRARLANLFWIIASLLVFLGIFVSLYQPPPDTRGKQTLAETRQSLRQQGFKTDLADFDFSTSSELRTREAILKAIWPTNRFYAAFINHPDLMEAAGTNAAIVVWKLDSLKKPNRSRPDNDDEMTWDEFREAMNINQAQVDAACAAILSGPIGFNLDSKGGIAMRLPHLALMKNLTQTLGSRTVLALHDRDKEAAWTNLMAATRLVTAWEPEPVEISHLVRFGNTTLAFNAIWQALQTNGWTDEQLARLQQEWESVDYFTNLPETAAFKRASLVAECQRDRQGLLNPPPTFTEFLKAALQSPDEVPEFLDYRWRQANYHRHGSYEDETALLLFYRDREVELRKAIQAPTWSAMRQLPGVTKLTPFQSNYHSRMQAILNLREMNMRFQRGDSTVLARAARAEAQRRLIITAIAVERFRGRHGSYPQVLADLAPEFLSTVPLELMDGEPLRYRPATDGHFLLYSVGLDCVDNGGTMQRSFRDMGYEQPPDRNAPQPEFDLVWPLPAGAAAMQEEQQIHTAAKKRRAKAEEERQKHYLTEISNREWQQSPARQSRVAKILAMNRPVGAEDPTFKGQSAGNLIRNAKVLGTNQLSIDALLTPKQIVTGNEPEDITFELPISYDSFITNNIVFPIVDADPEEELPSDCGGKVYDRERATNGDCLLVWHAIYDPPGRHAVQVYLALEDKREGTLYGIGPPIAVTTSNLCQFSLDSVNYDVDRGAIFHARLLEKNCLYTIECVTTNGEHLKTLTGSTSNGEFKTIWNLMDDRGQRLHGETFNSIVHITLPDSGRSQTLRGP